MFPLCPIKASKSKKSSHQSATRTNDVAQNNNCKNVGGNSTSPYRYVIAEHVAEASDELNVQPGDCVIYEYTDTSLGRNWSFVLCIKTNKRGFVPSHILSTEPSRIPQCKKKLPRASVDQTRQSSQVPNVHDQPSSNSDHNLQHQHLQGHDRLRFRGPHSLQGSSGKQSFNRYPELSHLSPPAYYNLGTMDRYEMECRQFIRENYGLFVVTNNFVAREENDISVRPGDFVTVLNKEDEDWFWVRRECDHAEGFVPSRFICDYEQVKSILNKGNSTVTMKSSNQNDFHTYMNHGPDKESLLTDQHSSLFNPL